MELYRIDSGSNKYINTYHFEEPNENILCDISIYTIELINYVSPENNITLVYCKYTLVYGKEEKTVPGFYGIALLKTNESDVNEYGIYKRFIFAGIFICKPVVYIRHCDMDIEDLEMRKCSSRYIYVGDRYNDIFPYSELKYFSYQRGGKSKRSERSKRSKRSKKSKKSKRSKISKISKRKYVKN
jgi:hypothetical protein